MGTRAPRLRGCLKTPQWWFKLSPGWFCFHLGSRKPQKSIIRFPQWWQKVRLSTKAGLFWNPSGSWVSRPPSKRNFKEGSALPGEAGLWALRGEGSTTQTSEKTTPTWASMPLSHKPRWKGSSHPWNFSGLGTEESSCPWDRPKPAHIPFVLEGYGQNQLPWGRNAKPSWPPGPRQHPLGFPVRGRNLVYGPLEEEQDTLKWWISQHSPHLHILFNACHLFQFEAA